MVIPDTSLSSTVRQKSESYLRSLFSDWEFWLVAAMWLLHFILLAIPFPLNYDSVNLALAITDTFDIGIHQPQPPGFLFQVLLGRAVHLFVKNPFTVLEIQSLLYLLATLLILRHAPARKPGALLLFGTMPLFLFFCAAPVMQAAALPFGAGIAFVILRSQKSGKGEPVLLSMLLATGGGFRYDIVLFLGPVTLLAIILSKPSLKQWIAAGVVFTAVSLSWYIPTAAMSGWASPLRRAIDMQKNFTAGISVINGGSLFENVRVSLRFLMYLPGVLGAGGLVFLTATVLKKQIGHIPVVLTAAVPFFLMGILLYMPLPQYYATVTGFVFAFILFSGRYNAGKTFTIGCITANLLFFWLVPRPIQPADRFHDRHISTSILKQLSFTGSNGAAVLLEHKKVMKTADSTFAGCSSFHSPLYWNRIWTYLAETRWHTRYVADEDSAECVMKYRRAKNAESGQLYPEIVIYRRRDSFPVGK